MINSIINEFASSLKALRDYVELIGPLLEEHIKKARQNQYSELAPLIIAYLKHNRALLEKMASTQSDPSKFINVLERFPAEIVKDEKGDLSFEFKGGELDFDKITSGLKSLKNTDYQEDLLYRSSLLNLISSLEWFLSQLLHFYFEQFPDAVGTRDKVFSIDDLKAFNTIQDARQHLIDSKVEDILRESFEYWIKYLKERINLSMSYIEPYMAQMTEVYQRRNIIVHNGGRINSIYLSKVDPILAKTLNIGDKVEINSGYFNDTIDAFELCFMLIAAELWKKLKPEDEERSGTILDLAFNHISEERWKIGEGLSLFLIQDKLMPESRRLRGQVNYWQSLKWQDRFEEIRSEVENADFSAKEPIFRLVLFALLDKEEEFFSLVPTVIKNEDLSYQELDTWPIFRSIRKSEKYAYFRQSNIKHFKDETLDPEIKLKSTKKKRSSKNKEKKLPQQLKTRRTVKKRPAKRVSLRKLK